MYNSYFNWVRKFPRHVVIRKEGYYYSARNESAEILHDLLKYCLGNQGENTVITGCPVVEPIINALEKAQLNYVIIENNEIIEIKDFENSSFCVSLDKYISSNISSLSEYGDSENSLINIANSLLSGVNPYTGEILDNNHLVNDENIQIIIEEGRKSLLRRERRKANEPHFAGEKWTDAEDSQLIDEWKLGMKITEIATLHQRTTGSINSRLLKLFQGNDPQFTNIGVELNL